MEYEYEIRKLMYELVKENGWTMTDALVKATKCFGSHPKGNCKGKGGRKRRNSAAVNRGAAVQITTRQIPHEEKSGPRGPLCTIAMEDRWCEIDDTSH